MRNQDEPTLSLKQISTAGVCPCSTNCVNITTLASEVAWAQSLPFPDKSHACSGDFQSDKYYSHRKKSYEGDATNILLVQRVPARLINECSLHRGRIFNP